METDIKTIVNIIKEAVKGYYVIIYRDTISYKIEKYNKQEFVSIFSNGKKWVVDSDGDLTRFMLVDTLDPTTTNSDILKTFNAYNVGNEVKISSVSVVCDWSIYGLDFNEKQPTEVLKMITK